MPRALTRALLSLAVFAALCLGAEAAPPIKLEPCCRG
jgi:hypothetical protein